VSRVRVRADRIVATAESIEGLHASAWRATGPGRPALVARADERAGNGAFDVTVRIVVTTSGGGNPDRTVAAVALDVS
jgi:hypothetical protein